MNLSRLMAKTSKALVDNSPAILTALGVTGTVTTAFFTAKASFKAADVLRDEYGENWRTGSNSQEPPTRKEKVKLVYKYYIPAVGTGAMTISCVVLANRIGTRRAAAVAAAYSITERAFVEYKDKVIEKIGEKQEGEIQTELAKNKVNSAPPKATEVIIAGSGEVLCLDSFSGRYFHSNMEALRRAENDINKQIINSDSASLSEFYNNVGLENTSVSDDMGWNTDKMLELHFDSVLTEEGRPVLVVNFATVPIREFWRFC